MSTKIKMPKLGMEMTEGAVVAWLIKEGDRVKKGDVVLQIETEKITYEVEAPASGTLRKIFAREGQVRRIGELLGVITADDEAFDEAEFLLQKAPLESAAVEGYKPMPYRSEVAARRPEEARRVVATPAARRLGREKGVDLFAVTGTGPGGRITEKNVLAAIEGGNKPAAAVPRQPTPRLGATMPLTRMREIIAERLTKSWEWPHIYLATEVDAEEMVELREELLPVIEGEIGQKLTYNDMLIKVVALAIEKFPLLNGIIEGDYIRIPEEINIGLAVALEDGLMVPVVRRANEKTLAEIVRLRAELVARARRRRLEVDELRGGTFSISNLGMFDVDFFTAILNAPQSGILSVGRIKETPAVIDGEIGIRRVIKLVLGVDHRIVDGAVAAAFLQELKRMLENVRGHVLAK